jgi:hypothetical protein
MMERAKPSSLIIMVELALPLLVAACAQPVMQSDKAPQQASDVTLLIGAQKLPPAPPAAPSSPPAQKLTTPAHYYEPVGPFL